ncbi:hypothetical protein RIF29_24166 [Crotalaria pallida]|uniref:Uncharacterized protein n=1 Tax=Crotalaria pallida TaxID=3830 RepID=A0AAN9EPD8_CROPI
MNSPSTPMDNPSLVISLSPLARPIKWKEIESVDVYDVVFSYTSLFAVHTYTMIVLSFSFLLFTFSFWQLHLSLINSISVRP